ncbi:MAG: hypothetical protein RH859_03405 [Longimicrobiales bacterium]
MAKLVRTFCVAFLAVAATATTAVCVSGQSTGATVGASVTILRPVTVTTPVPLQVTAASPGRLRVRGAPFVSTSAPTTMTAHAEWVGSAWSASAPTPGIHRSTRGGVLPQDVTVEVARGTGESAVRVVYTVAVAF